MEDKYTKDIINCIKSSLSKYETNVFDELCLLFCSYFEKSCNNIMELKKRTQKSKGTCFEIFCFLFLEQKGYKCWMINDLPINIRTELHLDKQDVGIDIIAFKNDKYYPVQCKFRNPTKDCKGRQVHRVTWRELSTFFSLCNRTGGQKGWTKHIIMTNADYCCFKGKKNSKDYTIAKKSFQNIDRKLWMDISSFQTISQQPLIIPSNEVIRNLRQNFLSSLSKNQ